MQIKEDQIKKFILDSRLLTEKELAEAEEEARKRNTSLKEVLLADGGISEDEFRRLEAYVLGIPYISLKGQRLDFDVLSLIPEPIARQHNIIAYKKDGNNLEVAMLDTDDLQAIEFIKKKTGLRILPRLTDTESIKSSLVQYQKTLKAEFGDIIQREVGHISSAPSDDEEASEEDLEKLAEDLPVIKIVNTLLKHAIVQDASDIHIEPMEDQLLIRYRIDGVLHDAMTLPKAAASGITARIKVLAGLKLDEKRLPQDGRFKMETETESVSFRVSTLPAAFGEKTVMRLLRENFGGFTLDSLGFHGEALDRIYRGSNLTTGMILVTGPTGSGKTTTLYTILDILNKPEVNISTIEDPIEYQVPRINQTQVKPDIGFTFANGLRALVRQDPDIIMVGEIRDGETADLATNAALTGHLVLSTVHTNSAAGTIPRLIDMGVEPFLLVSTVRVIVAQRLVRKLCKSKEKYTLSDAELSQLAEQVDMDRVLATLKEEKIVKQDAKWKDVPFYKPKESEECKDGYSGRIGIHEVLWLSDSIGEAVMKDATAEQIHKQAVSDGMLPMAEDGIFMAAQGITSIEEVFRVISN